MTKDEYKAKREASANAGLTAIATYINDSMIKDEYIESLESRIAELEAMTLDEFILLKHKQEVES